MGSYYNIVNIDKRQYLDPVVFDEPFTWRWVLYGYHAVAISFMVCDCRTLGNVPPPAGHWHGNRIVLAGDSAPPGEHGIATATPKDPDRNLYAMAYAEFEDISLRALAMLIAWRGEVSDELARKVSETPHGGWTLLESLGDILQSELADEIDVSEDCGRQRLERALARYVGPEWKTQYFERRRRRSE